MTPDSRPPCPVCYRAGTIPHPLTNEALECPHCHGTGFEPYWLGPVPDDDE